MVTPATSWSCPACRFALKRAELQYDVRFCHGCGGVWTDIAASTALRDFGEAAIAQLSREVAFEASNLASPDGTRERVCPQCQQALAQRNIGGKVLIDVCPAHGTWFDRDEIVQVIEAMRKPVPGGSGAGSYGYGTTNEALGQGAVALVQLLFSLFAGLKSE